MSEHTPVAIQLRELIRLLDERTGTKHRDYPVRVKKHLLEGLLDSHKGLLEALEPFAEIGVDLTDHMCHIGICPPKACGRCGPVIAARAVITRVTR